ncbi:MAG TPA: hypothetical protein VGP05_05865 [Pseudonocardia sp.]|nr:hypothetical protein [Pseudonocardia sp.]
MWDNSRPPAPIRDRAPEPKDKRLCWPDGEPTLAELLVMIDPAPETELDE